MEARITKQISSKCWEKISVNLKFSTQGKTVFKNWEPNIDIYIQIKPENIYHQETCCKRMHFKGEENKNKQKTQDSWDARKNGE